MDDEQITKKEREFQGEKKRFVRLTRQVRVLTSPGLHHIAIFESKKNFPEDTGSKYLV